ncbi:RNA polymerase sigma-70 factor (ECF subfamily) [Paenibacillus castaneae]|uniref:RNA polymerase sigma-70 factor n=1 Tax=Paenibacillus castaneae TaxID=474957 RepID=UPI000C9A72A1|nr:RNA polymerase sigma-70 factor [Paenibacillus castaneae]NIK79432.1 RNA polymerase sigma-70 factor (ECF subfamily) [Paenibacillus castaneae]
MDLEKVYAAYRPLLHSIAYRMLGSFSEAEDLVQDVFADFSQLDSSHINNEKAYLIRMVTNRSINYSQSARKRREVYTGEWLPVPDVSFALQDPAELYAEQESLSYALLVTMEQLTAVERAVFILRESLQYDYDEIAACLQKTEANCRKILSRAKEKLQKRRETLPLNSVKAEPLIDAFMEAAGSGHIEKLVALLTEDAILISDGGGKVRAAIFPIFNSARVIAFLKGVIPKHFLGDDYQYVHVNGQIGILLIQGGMPKSVISFQLDQDERRIERIYVMMNPDKLTHVQLP